LSQHQRDGLLFGQAILVGVWQLADTVNLQPGEVLFGNALFKNRGGGKFTEMSDRAGLETWWPWGIACGDFDNDGYEDLFIPSGMGYPFKYLAQLPDDEPGHETFVDRAEEFGIDPPPGGIHLDEEIGGKKGTKSSRARRGRRLRRGRPARHRRQQLQRPGLLLPEPGAKRNVHRLPPDGDEEQTATPSGAVVRLYSGTQIMTRQVNTASGYLAQSSRVIHFGLGERAVIDRVEITWPSGHRQTIKGPGARQASRRHRAPEVRRSTLLL